MNAPASYAGVYRIIAGGGPYTDTRGQVWQADAGFNTGNVTTTTATISGTSDPALYQSERWYDSSQSQLEYQLPVANGTYLVNLYFAETDAASQGTGLRVFDVNFQGAPVVENLDIFAARGDERGPGEECGGERHQRHIDDRLRARSRKPEDRCHRSSGGFCARRGPAQVELEGDLEWTAKSRTRSMARL